MNRRLKAPVCAAVAVCALLGACQRGPTEAEALAATKGYVEREDYKAAIVSAKVALQRSPDNAEVRRLLGLALLETGASGAAIVELRKAIELGASESSTVPALARSMLSQRQSRDVLLQFASTQFEDSQSSADLKTTIAAAHATEGQLADALRTVLLALQDSPGHARARLLQAEIVAASGDSAAALVLIDKLLADEPKNVSALIAKGDIYRYQQRNAAAALTAYRAAVAAKPDFIPAHTGLVSTLIETRDLPAAKEQFEKLKALDSALFLTRLLEAQLAFLGNDAVKTREIAGLLLKSAPNLPQVLLLAGAAELKLNSLAQAENFLVQALKADPRDPKPRRLLAELYLRTKQPQRALETVQPIVESESADAAMLLLAGQAFLQQGNAARSEALFNRAIKANPGNPSARTALALNKLARGNVNEGFAELEAAAASDSGVGADTALIAARMRANDLPGALRAVDALEKKEPNKPLAAVLRGNVQLRMKDASAAAASFEKALRIDSTYYPATAALATIDLAASNPGSAQRRFETLLLADPKDYRAKLGIAELKARTGAASEDVSKAIVDAVQANPSEPAPRLILVRYLAAKGDVKGALAAAQDADAALPGNPDVLQYLGRAQMTAGQTKQAVSTFSRLVALRPSQVEPELQLADAQLSADDLEAARRSFTRALKIAPEHPAGQYGLASVAIRQKRYADAIETARSMQRAQPKLGKGYLLQAEAEIAADHPQAAIAPLRSAIPLAEGHIAAIALHQLLQRLGQKDEAERLATTWKKEHPNEVAFTYYLGDRALSGKDFAGAEMHYRNVLAVQPDHALALNNVAWLMTQQQKKGAVAVAERANQLLPQQTALMDTLAWALANENQAARAIDMQKQAIARSPADDNLRLTLAKIYLKAGQRSEARSQLDSLAKLGDKFPSHGEVAELMKTL